MRILPLVFTVMIILGMMNSARLEQWLARSLLHQWVASRTSTVLFPRWDELQAIMYSDNRGETRQREENEPEEETEDTSELALYDPMIAEMQDHQREEEESKGQLLSYFSLSTYYNGEGASQVLSKWDALGKRLLLALYGDQPFFRELKANIPDVESQILEAMKNHIGHLKTAPHKHDLVEVHFEEEELRIAFCKMLHGTRGRGKWDEVGYPKLTDYVSFKGNGMQPISVFLAPPEMLFALFDSREVVEKVVEHRNELARKIRKGMSVNEAANEFALAFNGALVPEVASFVTFRTTKTKPPNLR